MLAYFMLLLAALVPLQDADQDQSVPRQPPQPTGPEAPTLTGEMRVELLGLGETRVHLFNVDPENTEPIRRQTRMQFQVTGADLTEVVRIGQVVLTEAVDDTGKELIDSSEVTEEKLNETRAVTINDAIIRQGGITMNAAMDASARDADKITVLKGSVAVAFGAETTTITIPDPLNYTGEILQHPVLDQLGLKIKVLGIGQFYRVPRKEQFVGLQFLENEKYFKEAKFYGEWMNEVPSRGRPTQTKQGEEAMLYQMQRTWLEPGDQMVLTVYTRLDERKLEFELNDIELP